MLWKRRNLPARPSGLIRYPRFWIIYVRCQDVPESHWNTFPWKWYTQSSTQWRLPGQLYQYGTIKWWSLRYWFSTGTYLHRQLHIRKRNGVSEDTIFLCTNRWQDCLPCSLRPLRRCRGTCDRHHGGWSNAKGFILQRIKETPYLVGRVRKANYLCFCGI